MHNGYQFHRNRPSGGSLSARRLGKRHLRRRALRSRVTAARRRVAINLFSVMGLLLSCLAVLGRVQTAYEFEQAESLGAQAGETINLRRSREGRAARKISARRRPGHPPDTIAPAREYPIRGIENVSGAFIREVETVAARLDTDPLNLLAVMSFETDGTFSPSIKNYGFSGATGLIQFMPGTARAMGTTVEALSRLSRIEQLRWVEQYFAPHIGNLDRLEDVYMAVLWPAAVGKGHYHKIFTTPRQYRQNLELDGNRDGKVTIEEATDVVRNRSFDMS